MKGVCHMLTVAQNIERLRENIARAAEKAHQRPDRIVVVAVTKTVESSRIREAWEAGMTHFGENRVQEALTKQYPEGSCLHMIGHLQTNKVKKALHRFSVIQSLDRPSLLVEIEKRASAPVECLVQVNAGNEEQKYGFAPENVADFVHRAAASPVVRLRGLMVVTPYLNDPEQLRPYFTKMRRIWESLRQELGEDRMAYLSMGMSGDYQIAIEEGANMVRLGTAIFGPRTT